MPLPITFQRQVISSTQRIYGAYTQIYFPQMTFYTLESKQWASQSIYSTWISMASPLLGISSTWVVLVANDTLGCLILMMPTQSFLSPPLALLIRYASNFPSFSHLTGFISLYSISMVAVLLISYFISVPGGRPEDKPNLSRRHTESQVSAVHANLL